MKAFLTVGDFARWEKFAGDAAVSSSASKRKLPRSLKKLPCFWENLPRFWEIFPRFLENVRRFYALCLPWLVKFRYLCMLERCVLAREKKPACVYSLQCAV